MSIRIFGLILACCLAAGVLPAQESEPTAPLDAAADEQPGETEPEPAPPEDDAAQDAVAEPETAAEPEGGAEPQSLYESTLRRDIETAGFYELVAWLEGLNQSTAGDKNALMRRVLEYYGLAASEEEEAEAETPLVVDSAARTRYFTLDEIDERYVRLAGGVTLILRDDERNVTHQIFADEVTYNQDLNVISASGNVIYTLDRSGTVEQFSGAALTVQLDDWEGAFVQGVTTRPRTIDGEQVDFSFEGRYITRSAGDVVVMEDGRITSSKADPPNYEIRAQKIWVLAPGEWGLRNAYLYVGRVPVFYFPFFFKPGNKLFFNPSVGVRDREGSYIQTTTYLIGEPEVPESSFSFLQIAEETGGSGGRKIEGLFLVPESEEPKDTAEPEPEQDPALSGGNGSVLRLMTDMYTKLGAYIALDGSFPDAGPLSNLKVYLGLGASRHIFRYAYTGQGVTYSPYYVSGGSTSQSWNGTQIGSVRLPIRFGLGLSATFQGTGFSVSGDIPYYSDSRFMKDFNRRAERIDWLGLLGQGSPVPEPALITNYEWALRGNWTPQIPAIAPWVQRVQLQNASVALRWREDTVADPPAIVAAADGSPEAGYYYPELLQSPNASGVIAGQLFKVSSSATADEESEELPESPLRPPWELVNYQPLAEDEYLRLPTRPGSLPATRVPEAWNAMLSYTVTPSGLLEHTFDSDMWDAPEDVDFAIAYSAASGRLNASLPLAVNLLSGALSLNGSLSANSQYRWLFNQSSTMDDTEWDVLERQADSYSSISASSAFGARLRPFPASTLWSASSVNYTINLLLYQLVYTQSGGTGSPPVIADWGGLFDQHLASWASWDEQFVRTHQVQMNAALDVWSGQALRLTVDLPPRTPRFVGQVDLSYSPVSVSVASGVVQESDKTWTVQPVTSVQRIEFGELGNLQNQLSVNVDPAELANNTTSARVGPVRASLEMRNTEGYTFGGAGVGWVSDGTRRFQPTRAEMSASLDTDLEPFWHNRVLFATKVSSSWNMNLLRFTESSFAFGLQANLEITDFLQLSFSSQSANTQSYVYIGQLASAVGRTRRSLVGDLLKSFNIFSRDQRVESAFNLQQIRVKATHNLEDWDLNVSYAGQPQIVTVEDPDTLEIRRRYDWQSSIDIELRWRAIRELSSNIRADDRTDTLIEGEGGWDLTFGSDS